MQHFFLNIQKIAELQKIHVFTLQKEEYSSIYEVIKLYHKFFSIP